MKKRLLSVFVFLAIFSFNCIGQQQIPIKNVPSPEIAGLGEYGKVPVSLYIREFRIYPCLFMN